MNIIDQKIENEDREIREFADIVKTEVYECQIREITGVNEIVRIVNKKVVGKLSSGFGSIQNCRRRKKLSVFGMKNAVSGFEGVV